MPRFSDYLRRGFGRGSENRLLTWRKGSARVVAAGPLLMADGLLHLRGGMRFNHESVSIANSPYKVKPTDYFVGVDTSHGAITVELPESSSVGAGFTFFLKDEGGMAAANNITVTTPIRETLEGSDRLIVTTGYSSYQLYTNGINWFVFG